MSESHNPTLSSVAKFHFTIHKLEIKVNFIVELIVILLVLYSKI